MKRCPTCQKTYPDNGPEVCSYDDMLLVEDGSVQYYPEQQQPPGGYPPPPGGGGYPPSGQPPYGGGYAPQGGGGLSKAAMIVGIAALLFYAIAFIIGMTAHPTTFEEAMSTVRLIGIFALVALLAGLAAIVLGIITLALANKNPNLSKAQGVIGLVCGSIPIILWIIGAARYSAAG